MNTLARRDAMLDAVEEPNGFLSLRDVVVMLVERGVSADTLIDDMENIRGLLNEKNEDLMLDVMDHLVGHCHQTQRILPRPQPGDADFGTR